MKVMELRHGSVFLTRGQELEDGELLGTGTSLSDDTDAQGAQKTPQENCRNVLLVSYICLWYVLSVRQSSPPASLQPT